MFLQAGPFKKEDLEPEVFTDPASREWITAICQGHTHFIEYNEIFWHWQPTKHH